MTSERETRAAGHGDARKTSDTQFSQEQLKQISTNVRDKKGDALSFSFSPEEKRFCAWRTEYPHKDQRTRKTKVPYTVGRRARANDASTWLTREEAEKLAADTQFRARSADGICGIGVFLGEVPALNHNDWLISRANDKILIGIDADTCRDPATGDFIRPWVPRLLETFDTYAEVSPSQTGIKIFAFVLADEVTRGQLSKLFAKKLGRQWKEPGQNHPPGIEVYTGDRYFTFTAQRLPEVPETINVVPIEAVQNLFAKIGPSVSPKGALGSLMSSGQQPGKKAGWETRADAQHPFASYDENARLILWKDAPAALIGLKTPRSIALISGDFSGINDPSNSGVAFNLIIECRRAEMSEEDSRNALTTYPHRDLSKYCGTDPDAERQWQRIWEKTQSGRELEVRTDNLPSTADEVIEAICGFDGLYWRDHRPVELSFGREDASEVPKVECLTANGVVRRIHASGRVWQKKAGDEGSITRKYLTLPDRVANLALDNRNAWRRLPHLDGITSAPLLSENGAIRTTEGYDSATLFYCYNQPALRVPERPTRDEAKSSLLRLRHHLRTFAFADSPRVPELNADVVDISKPPGADESAALYALMTAICRPSLWLAPGFLCTAASVTGAGAGKGLLVRAIVAIAFGIRPSAMSPGHSAEEMDKRLVAALIDARPVVFLDNVNGRTLQSDTLASALTERPSNLRTLGKSENPSVTAAAFIAITGNGLSVSEDNARRFVSCSLDGGEDAEARDFSGFPNPVEESFIRRSELLDAALTIWRWGRQNPQRAGKPIGSFEKWAEWVRDPLLALGCTDPAERIADAKSKDPQRAFIAELLTAWEKAHGEQPVAVSALDDAVIDLLNPDSKMTRQWVANRVAKLEGTRAIGLVLKSVPKTGKWSPIRYFLSREPNGQKPP